MRRTSGGGRKLFTAIEARIRADEINTEHGTALVLDGGGPMRVMVYRHGQGRTPLSGWLTRQNVLTWLDAFELGIVYTRKGPDAAIGIVEPEGDID